MVAARSPFMSKKSEREARERSAQQQLEIEAKFSRTLLGYLQGFATYYRQDPPTEQALEMYRLGLRHLTPTELRGAYEESIRKCKFFPTVAEMLECLKEWRERQPAAPTAVHYEGEYIPTAAEKLEFRKLLDKICHIGKKKGLKKPPREPGED
jgi:hypothetical protein